MVNTLLPVFGANLFKWFFCPKNLVVLVNLIFVVSVSILRHPTDTKAHQLILLFGVLYGIVIPQIKVTLQQYKLILGYHNKNKKLITNILYST